MEILETKLVTKPKYKLLQLSEKLNSCSVF